MRLTYLLLLFFLTRFGYSQILLPIDATDRTSVEQIQLTDLGQFGKYRKARPNIPGHYHTGIDIKRPHNNFLNEPVFAIAQGKVISKRTDGPYAQIILEHKMNNFVFWSLYEHVAGITVNVGEQVSSDKAIARFMNKTELNRFGWQFDHFHLEILKVRPVELKSSSSQPQRKFNSYTLVCYTEVDLNKYFYNPVVFFRQYK
jgi:hypothetical protein